MNLKKILKKAPVAVDVWVMCCHDLDTLEGWPVRVFLDEKTALKVWRKNKAWTKKHPRERKAYSLAWFEAD
jgi:hypothetical protein